MKRNANLRVEDYTSNSYKNVAVKISNFLQLIFENATKMLKRKMRKASNNLTFVSHKVAI